MFNWFRNRRRRKLLESPFPTWWEAILERNLGHYPRLKPDEQARLRDLTRILIAEKTWEGCGGLAITDEIKVTIAGSAGLLLLGLPGEFFERVDSIIVYPDVFRTPQQEDDWEDDELSDTVAAGQAVYRGPVLVSWKDTLIEARSPEFGSHVVLHEFAHQLDFLDNSINGTPPLGDGLLEEQWQTVMQAAFQRHVQAYQAGLETFFTEHAADDETEFFADATEAFYCVPASLRAEEPEVYELLSSYYRVNPVEWFPEAR